MRYRNSLMVIALFVSCVSTARAATSIEKIHNDKVVVTEVTLAPGQREAGPHLYPSIIVYMTNGRVMQGVVPDLPSPRSVQYPHSVEEGQAVSSGVGAKSIANAGTASLHFVRIDFLTAGSQETWGKTGLAPSYTVLVENQYARAYDIKIPAGAFEPQHTHHDRVVVSLSGAELEHILPDGTHQPSTLKTGEIVWRQGATHVGHNLGKTDLWVIAVEPK